MKKVIEFNLGSKRTVRIEMIKGLGLFFGWETVQTSKDKVKHMKALLILFMLIEYTKVTSDSSQLISV